MKFIIEKKSYVSKVTGDKKFAYNVFIEVNGIKIPMALKGDATALLIGHQLLENCDILKSLDENCSVDFEVLK